MPGAGNHEIGVQRIQRDIVAEIALRQSTKLETDALAAADGGQGSFGMLNRFSFLCLVPDDHLPDGLLPLNEGFCDAAVEKGGRHEDADQMCPVAMRKSCGIGGAGLAGRRWFEKYGDAFKRHW